VAQAGRAEIVAPDEQEALKIAPPEIVVTPERVPEEKYRLTLIFVLAAVELVMSTPTPMPAAC
jgi:hypothetical protein